MFHPALCFGKYLLTWKVSKSIIVNTKSRFTFGQSNLYWNSKLPKYYGHGCRLNCIAKSDVLWTLCKDCISNSKKIFHKALHKNDYLITKQLSRHLDAQSEQKKQLTRWEVYLKSAIKTVVRLQWISRKTLPLSSYSSHNPLINSSNFTYVN